MPVVESPWRLPPWTTIGSPRHVTRDFLVLDETVRAAADVGRHAIVIIEANLQRAGPERSAPILPARGGQAEMPFAESRRAIALTFAQRREREAVGFDVQRRVGGEHLAVLDGGAPVVTARHQIVARGRADRAGCVGVREAPALAGEPVNVRRLHARRAVTAHAAAAVIVGKDDDNVRLGRCWRGGEAERGERQRRAMKHFSPEEWVRFQITVRELGRWFGFAQRLDDGQAFYFAQALGVR